MDGSDRVEQILDSDRVFERHLDGIPLVRGEQHHSRRVDEPNVLVQLDFLKLSELGLWKCSQILP